MLKNVENRIVIQPDPPNYAVVNHVALLRWLRMSPGNREETTPGSEETFERNEGGDGSQNHDRVPDLSLTAQR